MFNLSVKGGKGPRGHSCSECSVLFYCKTARQGESPVSSALVEVYWVLERPNSTQLTDIMNAVATVLFGSCVTEHR